MVPILAAGLPASGLCLFMRRDIVHGPKEDNRFDSLNLYIYQVTQHIQYYVNHILDKNSICGKLLCNLSEQKRLELGTGKPLFDK